jgi:hypothetical protein
LLQDFFENKVPKIYFQREVFCAKEFSRTIFLDSDILACGMMKKKATILRRFSCLGVVSAMAYVMKRIGMRLSSE